MTRDPFDIEGPAVISFSGGRTSAYLLHRILDRGLNPDVHVLFCNTGKELPATLNFVRDCATQWDVDVHWLEYRRTRLPKYRPGSVSEKAAGRVRASSETMFEYAEPGPELGYVEVDYTTASRAGEPFRNLIEVSGLPTTMTRMCTQELKIRPMKKFMRAKYSAWDMVVGIRADEPSRVARMRVKPRERWENVLPLADAGVTEREILDWWAQQPFDLGLQSDPTLGTYQGNCDLCFLKATAKRQRVALEAPDTLNWWEKQERDAGSTFRRGQTVISLRVITAVEDGVDDDLGDCICHD